MRHFRLILLITLFPFVCFAQQGRFVVPVQTTHPKRAQWQQRVILLGTVKAIQGIQVKPEISGRVTNIFFHSGKTVQKGDPLVRIYPDILKAEIQLTEANLKLSQIQLNRHRRLIKQNAISMAEFDKSQAEFKANKARLEKAKAQLRQTLIEAPFSGQLGLRRVNLGDYITPENTIVELNQLDPIYVDFTVPQVYSAQFQPKAPVTIQTNIYPDQTFKGFVQAKQISIDPKTRSIEARAQLANPEHKLLPGAFVTVNLKLGQPQNVFAIPLNALLYDNEGAYLYIEKQQRAHKVKVDVIGQRTDTAYITGPLSPDTKIITAGQIKLAEGVKVAEISTQTTDQ